MQLWSGANDVRCVAREAPGIRSVMISARASRSPARIATQQANDHARGRGNAPQHRLDAGCGRGPSFRPVGGGGRIIRRLSSRSRGSTSILRAVIGLVYRRGGVPCPSLLSLLPWPGVGATLTSLLRARS